MGKNQSTESPARTSYEKITRATFGTFYRISRCPKTNNAPKPSPSATDNPKTNVVYSRPGEEIPHVSGAKPVKKFVRFSSKTVKKDGEELGGQKTFSEEKYNSYIDRTKMKMRAASDVGGGRAVSRRDSFNDRVSNYISRAKVKLRTTTTSVGAWGKTGSFDERVEKP